MVKSGGATEREPRSRRPRRRLVITISIVVVVVLGVVAVVGWWWRLRGPGRPSVDDAVDRFQSNTSTSRTFQGPAAGVYVYSSVGEERLSFLSTEQSQDGDLPGTVTARDDGCFDFTIEYNTFHRQSWTRCVEGDRLVERANTTDQKFDFGPLSEEEHARIECSPPTVFEATRAQGTTNPVRCTGYSQTTDATQQQRGRTKFVGRETVRVGSRRVPALHFRQRVEIRGEQRGSSREDVWFDAATWLPLREERSITVVSPAPAPLDEVTYTEQGRWRLTSLTPRS